LLSSLYLWTFQRISFLIPVFCSFSPTIFIYPTNYLHELPNGQLNSLGAFLYYRIHMNIWMQVTEDGKYSLVLVFEAKALELSDFEKRQAKFTSFFGPGIKAEIGKSGDDLYEVRLISEST
ncbi:unnamed protein product, partial [Urochloa humidicola]